MKKWLARKLFDTAVWLDWEEAVQVSHIVVMIEHQLMQTRPRKRGRPAGSKDKRPRKTATRKGAN
jgi:hypothetical protein